MGLQVLVRKQKGQLLIEVMAVILIFTLLITGLTVALVTSIRNVSLARNKALANHYVNNEMEEVQYQLDTNWISLPTGSSVSYNNDPFSRTISCVCVGNIQCAVNLTCPVKQVTITITWTEASKTYSSTGIRLFGVKVK